MDKNLKDKLEKICKERNDNVKSRKKVLDEYKENMKTTLQLAFDGNINEDKCDRAIGLFARLIECKDKMAIHDQRVMKLYDLSCKGLSSKRIALPFITNDTNRYYGVDVICLNTKGFSIIREDELRYSHTKSCYISNFTELYDLIIENPDIIKHIEREDKKDVFNILRNNFLKLEFINGVDMEYDCNGSILTSSLSSYEDYLSIEEKTFDTIELNLFTGWRGLSIGFKTKGSYYGKENISVSGNRKSYDNEELYKLSVVPDFIFDDLENKVDKIEISLENNEIVINNMEKELTKYTLVNML